MSDKPKPEWKSYEDLIHQIYTELEPVATVIKNDHIRGGISGQIREVDISVRTKVEDQDILIIIQVKHHKKRADITFIDAFVSVIKDLDASKGVLICSAGFTKGAKEYASRLKIDLYTAHVASKKQWQTEIKIPVIKKSIRIDLKIQHHYVPIGDITIDRLEIPFPEDVLNLFLKKWEVGELSKAQGTHYLNLNSYNIQYHKDLLPIRNGITYQVEIRHHFKFFVPNEYRGMRDSLTQKFTPSFMAINEEIPLVEDKTWKYIENPEDIALNTLHLNIEILDVSMLKRKMIRLEWKQ